MYVHNLAGPLFRSAPPRQMGTTLDTVSGRDDVRNDNSLGF